MKAISFIPLTIIFIMYISWQIFAVSANVWLSEWGTDSINISFNDSRYTEQRDYRLGVYGALGFGEGK